MKYFLIKLQVTNLLQAAIFRSYSISGYIKGNIFGEGKTRNARKFNSITDTSKLLFGA